MYEVEQEPFPEAFHHAWTCAAQHLQRHAGPGLRWVRAWLTPPVAEHLSFQMGNQLVFIFVEVDDWWTFDPDMHRAFLDEAREANAVPCLMPMQERGGTYVSAIPGWGLKHAVTGALVDPVALVSDELVEMTDRELQDFAVQVVRDYLRDKQGKELWSWQSSLHVDPSLWFEDEDGPAWVVVRAARDPKLEVEAPDNIDAIRETCARITRRGYFASVGVISAEGPDDPGRLTRPLYRGYGMYVRFTGLQEV